MEARCIGWRRRPETDVYRVPEEQKGRMYGESGRDRKGSTLYRWGSRVTGLSMRSGRLPGYVGQQVKSLEPCSTTHTVNCSHFTPREMVT